MPVDKATRRARHENAPSATVKNKGLPHPNQGAEGSVTFREISGSIKQLVKKGGRWKPVT